MGRLNRWVVVGLITVVPQLAGCQRQTAHMESEPPAAVDPIDGSEISRVTLTDHAMKRLDIRTALVTEEKSPRADETHRAVPYSSLIYDPQGSTWVYTSPKPRVFVREQVDGDFIQGDVAYLSQGPEVGTRIASLGVAELYGTEFEVGH